MAFDPEQAVLRHRTRRPLLLASEEPSEEEFALDWTLSPAELRHVLTHRGIENLVRYAAMLCVLRKYGRFLSSFDAIPASVLVYLCQQLDLGPIEWLLDYEREGTEAEHQREIAAFLGWRFFDEDAEAFLERFVEEQLIRDMGGEEDISARPGPVRLRRAPNLVEEAEVLFRQQRIVLPGPVVFERIVNAAYRRAEAALFETISTQIPEAMRQRIDGLLTVEENETTSAFFRFAEYPPVAKAMRIAAFLERYEALAELELEQIFFQGVNPRLLRKLAEATKTYTAWQIKRFASEKRYALAACFLHETKRQLLDYLVEMHRQFMIEAYRKSRHERDEAHLRSRGRMKTSVQILGDLARTVLALRRTGVTDMKQLYEAVRPRDVEEALEQADAFVRLASTGLLDFFHKRYNNFRRYFPAFVRLRFEAEPGSEPLFEAVELLRRLNSGDLKTLPADAPDSFIASQWLAVYRAEADPRLRRKTWELSLGLALRDGLRSGDLYLPGSRNHVSFWSMCINEQRWEEERPAAYADLGLPREADAALAGLVRDFEQAADRFERELPKNPFVEIRRGQLLTRRDKGLGRTKETKALEKYIQKRLRRVRIEQLLMEVDAACGFSEHLIPPGPRPEGAYEALMAAIVAHGTNLGVSTMADSTSELTVEMLRRTTRQYLGQEALRSANTALVNYHSALHMGGLFGEGPLWGEGTRSSSDGQRFGVRRSSLVAAFYPRYFGYYDRAVSVYTHVSDHYRVLSTQVIACSEREVLYVLNGLLENDTMLDIKIHHTDTHGVTEHVCGLCFLLGFSFMPRIKGKRAPTFQN